MARAPKKQVKEVAVVDNKERPPKRKSAEKKEIPVEKKEKKVEKKVKVKAPKKKVERKSKPSYARMISKALSSQLKEDSPYLSLKGISKFIEENYPVGATFHRFVKMALKRGLAEGVFIKLRGSFRLSAKAKKKRTSSSSSKRESSRKNSDSPRKKSPAKKERKEKKDKKEKPEKSPETKKRKAPAKRSEEKEGKKEKPAKKARGEKEGEEEETKKISKKPEGLKFDHFWQYKDGPWKNYDGEASNTVEQVYQNYLANKGDTDVRAVKSGSWEYMVDFLAMKQTNIQHDNHTVRDIRRLPVTG